MKDATDDINDNQIEEHISFYIRVCFWIAVCAEFITTAVTRKDI